MTTPVGIKKKKKRDWKRYLPFYLMGTPLIAYLFINNYMPLYGLLFAFKDVNMRKGVMGSAWVGLKNFEFLFATSDAFIMTRNTILYNLVFLVLGPTIGIAVAICLNSIKGKRSSKIYQTSILLPQLISMVIVAYIVYALLSNETGMINKMLGDNAVNFYAEKQYWPFILVFIQVWKQLGYNAIIFLSSLVGIDKSIYEASRVDGANRWQTLWSVTLPMLRPIMFFVTTLLLINSFKAFDHIWVMTGRGPGNSTTTLVTYIYSHVFDNAGLASAASAVLLLVVFIITMVDNKIGKDGSVGE